MRKLLIALGVVLVVLVGADIALRLLAQYWVSRTVQGSLGLEERPSVSLGGFPFVVRLLSGDLPSVDVESHGPATIESLPVHDVSLSLRDVQFSPGDLVLGDVTSLRAGRGNGTVTMTEQDVNQALPDSVPVTVRLESGGVTVVAAGTTVRARPALVGGRLVLEAVEGSLPVTVSVALPELLPGITYTDIRVDGDTAVLSFTLADSTFRLPAS